MYAIILIYKLYLKVALQFRDNNGRRVYMFRIGKWEPSKVSLGTLYSVVYSMWELISLEPKSQVAGVTMVIDANGYGYKHFTAISMTDMKMSFKLMEVGLPFSKPRLLI